jgi:hypothetical protein
MLVTMGALPGMVARPQARDRGIGAAVAPTEKCDKLAAFHHGEFPSRLLGKYPQLVGIEN